MKALTLTQPWATLVAIGAKRIETRSWKTTYRGTLAIHAAVGTPKWARDVLVPNEPFRSTLANAGIRIGPVKNLNWLPLGAIVAVCELVDCMFVMRDHWILSTSGQKLQVTKPELEFGDYSPGRYAWLLQDVRALPRPIPAKGSLGLWDWEASDSVKELMA